MKDVSATAITQIAMQLSPSFIQREIDAEIGDSGMPETTLKSRH
jgi:hypothetical protein